MAQHKGFRLDRIVDEDGQEEFRITASNGGPRLKTEIQPSADMQDADTEFYQVDIQKKGNPSFPQEFSTRNEAREWIAGWGACMRLLL